MEWPGWGGFFIGMVSSLPDIVTLHMPLKIALESMKTIAGQIKIRRSLRPIQVTQNVRDPAHLIGTDLARVPW